VKERIEQVSEERLKEARKFIVWGDVLLALAGASTIVYMLVDFNEFVYRAVTPDPAAATARG
jgi:TRAP-type uncharacterized transport system fused permease subunit